MKHSKKRISSALKLHLDALAYGLFLRMTQALVANGLNGFPYPTDPTPHDYGKNVIEISLCITSMRAEH